MEVPLAPRAATATPDAGGEAAWRPLERWSWWITSSVSSLDTGQSESDTRVVAQSSIAWLLSFLAAAEFSPSEPFLTDFLISKGFSNKEVSNNIFDLWLYFRLPALLVMGVAAETLGSGRMLVVGSAFGTLTAAMTLCCNSLILIQVTQLTVALSVASHTGAFYALLFELSARTDVGYQAHVHWAKATLVLANCVAGVLGSFLRRSLNVRYAWIFGVSLVSQAVSLAFAAMVVLRTAPLVSRMRSSFVEAPRKCAIWRDVWHGFCLVGVAEWTLWSVAMHTGHIMVTTFWQPLLREKTNKQQDWNGLANAVCYFLGAVALIASARCRRLADPMCRRWMIVASLVINGVVIVCMGLFSGVLLFYGLFAVFQVVFRLTAAVATQQVGVEVRANGSSSQGVGIDVWCVDGVAPTSTSRTSRARLALVLSVTEVFGAVVQSLVQLVFNKWQRPGHKHQLLSVRFEALGAGLIVVAAIFGVTCAGRALNAATRGRLRRRHVGADGG